MKRAFQHDMLEGIILLYHQMLYNLYSVRSRRIRAIVRKRIIQGEGGEMFSPTIRKIFRDYHHVEVGAYSYGCFFHQNIPPGTKIGNYCSFARNVCILNGNHPMNFKSLHPFFYNPSFGFVKELKIKRTEITIENDVWIGQNVIVLPSVSRISNGAAIGAGSIVTKNVPAFAVVAGNPAKIIRFRFPETIISEILASKWWELDIYELKKDEDLFKGFVRPLEFNEFS